MALLLPLVLVTVVLGITGAVAEGLGYLLIIDIMALVAALALTVLFSRFERAPTTTGH